MPSSSNSQPRRGALDPLRIVSIGGGTGLSTLLKGLKKYAPQSGSRPAGGATAEISAIVTVTDDGGSSGRLRRELDMLPPGDIRNCMVALAGDESLLSKLFQYRFDAGKGLKGHSFGNLFLAVLSQITGDFQRAIQLSSEVLAICGRIFPSTTANVSLRAHLANGKVVDGESRISRSGGIRIERIEVLPSDCKALPAALDAIRKADLITFGPGSLYTSVVPNLLVRGTAKAIAQSPALKASFVNLMWQPGETTGLSAAEHIAAIERHAGRHLVDVAVVNTAPIPEERLSLYKSKAACPVEIDMRRLMAMGVQVLARPLLAQGEKVRHDPDLTAEVAIDLARRARRRALRAVAQAV